MRFFQFGEIPFGNGEPDLEGFESVGAVGFALTDADFEIYDLGLDLENGGLGVEDGGFLNGLPGGIEGVLGLGDGPVCFGLGE